MAMPAPAPLLNNPIFSPPLTITNSLSLPLSLPPGMFFQEPMEEKPQLFAPGVFLNHRHQQSHPALNPAFFLPLPSFPAQPDHHHLLPPHPKHHHSIPLNPTAQITPPNPQDLFLRRNQPQSFPYQLQPRPMKPKAAAGDEAAAAHHHLQHQQHQALVDQLLKAAELAEAGNTVSAREILARLNHHLPSPLGKPLLRSAFFFKEALHLLLAETPNRAPFSTPLITPLDVVFKLSAYKAFSEVSPVLQFTNFTCTQALLEDVGSSDRIHIIDFDIGIGGQWSSFMQELAHRRSSAAPFLKITAFVSPCSYLPLELNLTRDNLSHFASDLNIPFEFSILSIDSFNPAELLAMSNGTDEAIAVNLPVGSGYNPSFPTLLRLVKQLSPKIVVSVDQGCDRSDLPFSHHFLHAFQSCMILLDSIDAAGTNQDAANKIERFLVQPRIENAVLGRRCAPEKMLPWRTLFTSSGFMPVQFSNFTETQAECLLKRVQVRGFHVDKRQASLFLYWQRGELVSVSAWRC